MSRKQSLNKTIAQIWEDKYVVPLYQRNFSWTEEQIGQLLQDIYDNAPKSQDDQCGNYYLGSLVVLERKDGTWEVIDGQQRLTCLHFICKYLNILKKPCLIYDSRPEVESFFADLFVKSWNDFIHEYNKIDNSKISRLKDALRIVENFKIRTGKGYERSRYTAVKSAAGRIRTEQTPVCCRTDSPRSCRSQADRFPHCQRRDPPLPAAVRRLRLYP